jgi:hypothetical protein
MRKNIGVTGLMVSAFLCMLGAFLPWYDNRSGAEVPVKDLLTGISDATAPAYSSAAAVLIVIGVIAIVGAVGHSRLAAWVVVLSTTLLMGDWIILQSSHVATFSAGDLDTGAWLVMAGTAVTLFSALAMGPLRVGAHSPGSQAIPAGS